MFWKSAKKRVEETWEAMKDKDVLIVDVRSPLEYKQGHVDGAINIDVDNIEVSKILPKGKKAKIAVYCASGARSKRAYKKLQRMGYEKAINLGGLTANIDYINQEAKRG